MKGVAAQKQYAQDMEAARDKRVEVGQQKRGGVAGSSSHLQQSKGAGRSKKVPKDKIAQQEKKQGKDSAPMEKKVRINSRLQQWKPQNKQHEQEQEALADTGEVQCIEGASPANKISTWWKRGSTGWSASQLQPVQLRKNEIAKPSMQQEQREQRDSGALAAVSSEGERRIKWWTKSKEDVAETPSLRIQADIVSNKDKNAPGRARRSSAQQQLIKWRGEEGSAQVQSVSIPYRTTRDFVEKGD